MKKGQGRKDRDQRYYEANKVEINRRRRERRQRKKERAESGIPMLKLVENPPAEGLTTDHDPASGQVATDHVRTDHEVSVTNHTPASDWKTRDREASCHGQAVSDHIRVKADHGTSDRRTSGQEVTDYKAADCDAELAMIVSYDGMRNPTMENLRFQANNAYMSPGPSESKSLKPVANSSGRVPMLVGFHLIVTLCLAALGTCLQFEFYREHDVLPGYALSLAIAGAASMLALATVRFPGFRDWPRKLVYAAFYVFFVASSSYHVLSKTWDKSAKQLGTLVATNVSTSDSEGRALEVMTKALEQATKNRAYKTMGILGAAVAGQVKQGTPITPAPEPAGIPREAVSWTGAVILIVLRALLEAAQAIGATALRGYFGARRYNSQCSSRAAGTAVSYQ